MRRVARAHPAARPAISAGLAASDFSAFRAGVGGALAAGRQCLQTGVEPGGPRALLVGDREHQQREVGGGKVREGAARGGGPRRGAQRLE